MRTDSTDSNAVSEAARLASNRGAATPERLFLRVAAVRYETEKITSFEFHAIDGAPLPQFSAGAHISIAVPYIGIRRYSLCSAPGQTHRYMIAIQREDGGRGGSVALHRLLRVGAIARITAPVNEFALADSGRHILIAGGIGITPMLSMAYELEERGDPFHLFVLNRAVNQTPFREEIQRFVDRGVATLHHSRIHGRADLRQIVSGAEPDLHVYCCGPNSLIDAVKQAAAQLSAANLHFEIFAPAENAEVNCPFSVTVASTGQMINVGASESLLDALRREDIAVDSSCEIGTCGSCKIGFRGGRPFHRDALLSDEERERYLLCCVSRAAGKDMILDI